MRRITRQTSVPSPDASSNAPAVPAVPRAALWLLSIATAVSFFVVLQNYGLDILPDRRIHLTPGQIRPFSGEKTFAYVFDFDGSEPDRWPSARSRVRLFEDAREYPTRLHSSEAVQKAGGLMFSHEPGRIVFSTFENTDPRTNGRSYDLSTPILYGEVIGDAAMLAFLGCMAAWYMLTAKNPRPAAPRPPQGNSHWRWHLAGAFALFGLGLYCNTGTLAPYAITTSPVVAHSTGYAYNPDHIHFRVLFEFVDGRGRAVWDHAILLRRILFPVLGWPLMKALGFELGGTLASLALNIAAFIVAVAVLRRRVGEKGAVLAGWLLSLYPGASYWAGLPYSYALIFPASLLLMLGLMRLCEPAGPWTLVGISLAMGAAYLGYDLAITFIPATLIVLCWQRRFVAAAASAAVQLTPAVAWIYALGHAFRQPLQNDNSGIYVGVVRALFRSPDLALWWRQVVHAAAVGFDIFFASNFIFIPALFLLAVVLNPLTSRIRFHAAEIGLLASGLALFAVLNLAPAETGGWEMRGAWISRIYQPVFPALVVFIARWWQGLPPLTRVLRALVVSAVGVATAGDALIVFGPILNDPLKVSEGAFYRFYDHTDDHFIYESNLSNLGRRPLGFLGKTADPTEKDVWDPREAQLKAAVEALAGVRSSIVQNRSALRSVQRDFRQVGLALADARCRLFTRQLERRKAKGEVTAEQALSQAKTADDFVGPSLRAVLSDAAIDSAASAQAPEQVPSALGQVQAAIAADSEKLNAIQHEILRTQDELTAALSALAEAREELKRPDEPQAAPGPR